MQVPYLFRISETKNMLQEYFIEIFRINRYRKVIPFFPVIEPTI